MFIATLPGAISLCLCLVTTASWRTGDACDAKWFRPDDPLCRLTGGLPERTGWTPVGAPLFKPPEDVVGPPIRLKINARLLLLGDELQFLKPFENGQADSPVGA